MSQRTAATGFRRWLCVLTLSWVPVALSAGISASVDRSSVSVDESFHLIFEADGEIEAEPDLSPLEESFEIINQSRSQNISIINGRATRREAWQIELMPLRAGSFTIPAIGFGSAQSNPLTILVRPAGPRGTDASSHFFVEVEVDEHKPFVQQQVIYTVRVFRNTNATSARLSEPNPEGVDTIVERLGGDSAYVAHRAGRRYQVFERRYAIFPQGSGTLVLPPLRFQAEVIERGRPRSSIFDTVRTRNIRVRSEALEIPVLPAPADAPRGWLPARSLSLTEAWPAAGPISVGDALTRRITIRAADLTAAQLPELAWEPPEGIKQYPEQPELENLAEDEGITGIRVQTTALVATRPGVFTLPAVTLTWWNVETRQIQQARLPPRTIEIIGVPAAPAATGQLSPSSPPDTRPEPVDDTAPLTAYWRWLSGVLALLWLLTLWRWRLDRRRWESTDLPPRVDPAPTAKRSLTDLQRACADNDAAAARDALLAWSAATWPQSPPVNLTQLVARCGDALATVIADLQRALYAEESGRWNGAQLWAQAKRIAPRPAATATAPGALLEPLYKLRGDKPSEA